MKSDQMYYILFNAIQEGSISAVQKAASQIFESAVSVTDASFRVLAADTDPGCRDDMLEKIGDHVYVSEETLRMFREHNLIAELSDKSHKIIVVDWDFFKSHPHLTTGIFWEGNILGTIVVLVDNPCYTKEQEEALYACSQALTMVMHSRETGRRFLAAERDHFLNKLFFGSATEKDLNNSIKNGFFAKSERYIVLASEYIPDAERQRTLSDNTRALFYVYSGIAYYLSDIYSMELERLEKEIERRGYRYGLSYTFRNPLLASKMAKQAAAVLDYGNRSGQNKAEWQFPEHALDMMLQHIAGFSDYTHPAIFEIRQYDRKYNTQYLYTLKMWLENRMDYIATAKSLNLHRNSLYYRMQRIRDLFDLELDKLNIDVQLYLSFFSDETA